MMSLLPPLTIFCVCACVCCRCNPLPSSRWPTCSSSAYQQLFFSCTLFCLLSGMHLLFWLLTFDFFELLGQPSFETCLPFFFWGKEKTFHFKTCQCTICKVALPEPSGQHLSTPQPSHQPVSFVIPLDHLNTHSLSANKPFKHGLRLPEVAE